MSKDKITKSSPLASQDVGAFLSKVSKTPMLKPDDKRGRLVFAMDATASRESSWDRACQIQAQMFTETAALGGLEIQLCYYRGFNEFNASDWCVRSSQLLDIMSKVQCLGGHTQIEKVLAHTINTSKQKKVNALVFVGDCIEELPDRLCQLAGELGLLNVPVFIFHEGGDVSVANTFRQIAKLNNGAYCPFNANSAKQLRDLLSAVAVYAAGGRQALQDFHKKHGTTILKIPHQS